MKPAQIKIRYAIKHGDIKEVILPVNWHELDKVYVFSSLVEEAKGYLSVKLGWDGADMTYFSVELLSST